MKVAVLVLLTVVVLTINTASAQDIHAPQQSYADIEKQEDQSESEDELLANSVAEAVDNNADKKPSSESGEIETDDSIETYGYRYAADFEAEVAGHDPASEFYDADDLESEGKDIPATSQQPSTEFPPPFDHNTVDSSNVAQVAHFVQLMDADCSAISV